ncbi:MAG: 2-isopropylmalate synthase [Candidatus Omnitrophica bacterium]|nr:2-isopropylmalate synthase [Candidatus Omnitrophota bacterium]
MEKILIFDTTLRDGEQAPGASLTAEQKLEVAFQLEKLGVDIIEAGFPVASPGDFNAVNSVARSVKKCVVCGLARCVKADIEAVHKSLIKARNPRIHVFLATSKIHLQYKFKKAEDEIIDLVKYALRLSRNYFSDIEFSPEDATRTDKNFLFRVIETAINEGAKTINVPDTVGYSYPHEISSLISSITNNVPNINKAVISIHCHDDLGMASANSLSAILGGARQIHCTINGIGERAGNASLEEIVMALKTRHDVFGQFYNNINTKELCRTSKAVSTLTGFIVPPNKAIVGDNAFRHESGIHQDAVLKKRTTYEIIDPKDVGMEKSGLVLGKHSGRHALIARLKNLGLKLDEKKVDLIFKRFKDLADKKKEIFDDDLVALVEEETREKRKGYELVSIRVFTGTDVKPEATVRIKYKKKIYEAKSSGDGPVDACYKAIDKITKIKTKLITYGLEAITKGRDAQGLARVEIQAKARYIHGKGASTDILEASAKAYLDALSRLG